MTNGTQYKNWWEVPTKWVAHCDGELAPGGETLSSAKAEAWKLFGKRGKEVSVRTEINGAYRGFSKYEGEDWRPLWLTDEDAAAIIAAED